MPAYIFPHFQFSIILQFNKPLFLIFPCSHFPRALGPAARSVLPKFRAPTETRPVRRRGIGRRSNLRSHLGGFIGVECTLGNSFWLDCIIFQQNWITFVASLNAFSAQRQISRVCSNRNLFLKRMYRICENNANRVFLKTMYIAFVIICDYYKQCISYLLLLLLFILLHRISEKNVYRCPVRAPPRGGRPRDPRVEIPHGGPFHIQRTGLSYLPI